MQSLWRFYESRRVEIQWWRFAPITVPAQITRITFEGWPF